MLAFLFLYEPCKKTAERLSLSWKPERHLYSNIVTVRCAVIAFKAARKAAVSRRGALCVLAAAPVDISKSPKSQGFTMPGAMHGLSSHLYTGRSP